MAILTERKIKNIVFNFIENATDEELKEMAEKINEKFNGDVIKKCAKNSLLKYPQYFYNASFRKDCR